MSFRVILARVNGTAMDISVLNGALALAKPSGGHIEALFTRPSPHATAAITDDDTYPGYYETILKTLTVEWDNSTDKAHKQFEKWRTANQLEVHYGGDDAPGPTVAWREETGSETAIVRHAARLADLIVVARPAKRSQDRFDLAFGTALLESGRPIILMPPKTPADTAFRRILIAWNGSSEAARAVAASLPLLNEAEDVVVFTASEGSVEPGAAQELVDYLKWHGVNAAIHETARKANSVETALLGAAKRTRADVLVMGAYTHSRLRELIFGGVTRHMLSHAPLPVLMSH